MDPDSTDRGAGDLWDLTIDDLFSSSDAAASALYAAIPGPFAVDLCASVEPATKIAAILRDFEQLHVYQVTDWKDEQLVFRLRLGPISSELEADAILSIVRRDYPEATTVPVSDDDLRMIALVAGSGTDRQPKSAPDARAPSAAKADPQSSPQPLPAAPKAASATVVASAAAAPQPTNRSPTTAAVAASEDVPFDPDTTVVEETIDLASVFRDLASELLSPRARKSAAAPASTRLAEATAELAPVLAAPRPANPAPAVIEPGAAPAAAQPAMLPPVLSIDAVARPPRERVGRRGAATEPSSTSRHAGPPESAAKPAGERPTPPVLVAEPSAAAAPKHPPAPVASRLTAEQPAPAARLPTPLTPPPLVAPSGVPGVPGVPAAPASLPRTATSVAPTATAKAAVAATNDARVISPAAPIEPARPPVSAAVAPPAPPRPAQPAAPPGPAPFQRSVPPPAATPTRAPDSPRVALRGTPAEPIRAPLTAAKAEAAAVSPGSPAVLTLAAEPPTAPDVAGCAPSAARTASPMAAAVDGDDFELELLPDDLELRGAVAAATAPVPASSPAGASAAVTPSLVLELVPDEPRPLVAAPSDDVKAQPPAPVVPPKTVAVPVRVPAKPAAPVPVIAKAAAPAAPPPRPSSSSAMPSKLAAAAPAPAAEPAAKAPAAALPKAVEKPAPSPGRLTQPTPASSRVTPPAASPGAGRTPPVARPAMPAAAPVARAAQPPATGPSKLAATAATAATAAPKPAERTARPAMASKQPSPAASAPSPAAAAAATASVTAPMIDSTQTMRALIVPQDPSAPTEKLLVIQLVLSEQEIAPESVPDLAIFKEYRLYSAVGHHEGKVLHALRLGFFSDEGPAEAVAGYLRAFFDAPIVTRISTEERERFAHRRLSAKKGTGETGVHARIELASTPSAPATSLADLSARTRIGSAKSGQGR